MAVAATFDKVAERAATLRPARVALSVLAAPFYVLGLILGVLWLAAAWAYAAVLVGIDDGRPPRKPSTDRADGAI